jgi:hypothetical protein
LVAASRRCASVVTGLLHPYGLAVVGSTLYVVQSGSAASSDGTVGAYDATTGLPINANLITWTELPR